MIGRMGKKPELLQSTLQDLRFALRQLRKNPGFAGTAILVLALGMAASVAIFAFVDAALLQPLPYQNPSRLVVAYETTNSCRDCNLSYPDYLDWKKANTSFQLVRGMGRFRLSLAESRRSAGGSQRARERRLLPQPGRGRDAGPRLYRYRRHARRAAHGCADVRRLAEPFRRAGRILSGSP